MCVILSGSLRHLNSNSRPTDIFPGHNTVTCYHQIETFHPSQSHGPDCAVTKPVPLPLRNESQICHTHTVTQTLVTFSSHELY